MRPSWSEPPSLAELGPIAWFRAKLDERPIRADRSRALHDEPTGRLDKLDVWILVVLLASMLGVRMFRLSEPYQMHFDEVYHARTGTEFLQSWRYGYDHVIYEWTHPHLAKYAMAGGLVAWGNDRVTATSNLGVPVLDAVVEPGLKSSLVPSPMNWRQLCAPFCFSTAKTARTVLSSRVVNARVSFAPSKRSTGRPFCASRT